MTFQQRGHVLVAVDRHPCGQGAAVHQVRRPEWAEGRARRADRRPVDELAAHRGPLPARHDLLALRRRYVGGAQPDRLHLVGDRRGRRPVRTPDRRRGDRDRRGPMAALPARRASSIRPAAPSLTSPAPTSPSGTRSAASHRPWDSRLDVPSRSPAGPNRSSPTAPCTPRRRPGCTWSTAPSTPSTVRLGGPAGALGFPTTDPYAVGPTRPGWISSTAAWSSTPSTGTVTRPPMTSPAPNGESGDRTAFRHRRDRRGGRRAALPVVTVRPVHAVHAQSGERARAWAPLPASRRRGSWSAR